MTDLAELGFVVRTEALKRAERGLDGIVRAGQRTERSTRSTGRASERMAHQIERSTRRASAGFDAMDRAAGFARNAIVGLLGAMTVRALTRFASAQLEAAAAIGESAEVAGITTDAIQELRYAFTTLGKVTDTEVDAALRRFNRRLGLAREGAGPAKQAFDAMFGGVSQFSNTEQALDAVIQKISAIEDQATRAALASSYFGEDAGPLLAAALGKGSAAMDQMRRDAHDLGLVLDQDIIANADEIRAEFDKAQRILSTAFMRALNEAAPLLLEMANSAARLASSLSWGQSDEGKMYKEFTKLLKQIDAYEKTVDSTFNKIFNPGRVARMKEELVEMRARANELSAALGEMASGDSGSGGGSEGGGQNDLPTPGVPDEVLAQFLALEQGLEKQIALYGEASEAAKLRYEIENSELSQLDDAQQQRLISLADELDAKAQLAEQEKELDALRKAIEQDALDRMDPTERIREQYEHQLELLRGFHEEKLLTDEELREYELIAEENKQAALTEAAKKGAQDRARAEQQAQQAIQAMRMQTAMMAVGLIQSFAGQSKEAAIAAIALEKGVAAASVWMNTLRAASLAMAQLGPLGGGPAAAKAIMTQGKLQMGMIAATGLAQAAQVGSGGASLGTPGNPVHTQPSTAPPPALANEQPGNFNQIIIHGDVSSNNAELLLEELKGLINDSDYTFIDVNSRQAQMLRGP